MGQRSLTAEGTFIHPYFKIVDKLSYMDGSDYDFIRLTYFRTRRTPDVVLLFRVTS